MTLTKFARRELRSAPTDAEAEIQRRIWEAANSLPGVHLPDRSPPSLEAYRRHSETVHANYAAEQAKHE